MKTKLKKEVNNVIEFFIDSDLEIYGKVSEETKEIIKTQKTKEFYKYLNEEN